MKTKPSPRRMPTWWLKSYSTAGVNTVILRKKINPMMGVNIVDDDNKTNSTRSVNKVADETRPTP